MVTVTKSSLDAMASATWQKIVQDEKITGDKGGDNTIPCAVTIAILWAISLKTVQENVRREDMSVLGSSLAWHYLQSW